MVPSIKRQSFPKPKVEYTVSAEKADLALKTLHTAAARTGVKFDHAGDTSLLLRRLRVLLVSRDTSAPAPTSPWLRALCSDAERAIDEGETLLTGTGRVAYELPLLLSAKADAPLVVLQKEDETPVVTLPPDSLRLILKGRVSDTARDAFLGELVTTASRIAVRSGGNMAALAEKIAARGGHVRFVCIAENDPTPRQRWPKRELSGTFDDWPYLTHFTREADEAWPGETREDYLKWLSDPKSSQRKAFATLCRILCEQRVRGAGRFIRGGTPVTCWTELPPDRVAGLRCWRKGLRRWNFTPYGIAIHRDTIEELGARAVRYDATEADPFTQTPRSGTYDWTAEREWRVLGDVDLSRVPKEKMLVLTATELESETIRRKTGWSARATEILDV